MNCMNCGAPLNKTLYCPTCGFHVEVQKKIWHLSNLYYNRGLDKAQIRDLSGAIELLKQSIKFNKLNIQARNLLGLVYFETGEAVAALSEWVISKNIQPENNIACEYIDRLQENANKLDIINQTIKKYNESLKCCREGSEDVAVIQLKKILSQNPKLIKGYHLLSLIYLKQEEYEKARKILKKAAKIDKTNSTTLRFLKEVDEQTGTQTNLEPRVWRFSTIRKTDSEEKTHAIAYLSNNEIVVQPPAFRETSLMTAMINMGVGFLVGACLVWFLLVPANTQKINREANEKVVSYSNTMASQAAELTKLKEQIAESEELVSSASIQMENIERQVNSYVDLLEAYDAYREGRYSSAANLLKNVDADLLSGYASEVYDEIYLNIQATLKETWKEDGIDAFYDDDYETAIDYLSQFARVDTSDYEVLNVLAHAYRCTEQYDKAVETFQMIVDRFAGSKAALAQKYIDNGGRTLDEVWNPTEEDETSTGEEDEPSSEE